MISASIRGYSLTFLKGSEVSSPGRKKEMSISPFIRSPSTQSSVCFKPGLSFVEIVARNDRHILKGLYLCFLILAN